MLAVQKCVCDDAGETATLVIAFHVPNDWEISWRRIGLEVPFLA
jgi:hypothetical protein